MTATGKPQKYAMREQIMGELGLQEVNPGWLHNYAWGSKFPLHRKSLPAKINFPLATKITRENSLLARVGNS